MKAPKTLFICQSCGSQSQKWLGRCDDCDAWNSFVEEKVAPAGGDRRGAAPALGGGASTKYKDVDTVVAQRLSSGHERVRSGTRRRHRSGIARPAWRRARDRQVDAAAPGGGAFRRAHRAGAVLLGEESEHQIKLRGQRLGVKDGPLYLLAETCVERLIEEVERLKPALLIVDSIQTVFSLKMPSAPGSVGQVRQAATDLLFTAKGRNLPTILVGHVTKDGSLAGPKVLEHVVDTVLYFEGAAASRAPHRARRQEPVRRRQ